jgi:polyisoprenoid-binding protein YceI
LGDNRYRITGDLTINGITKEVPLDAEGFGMMTKNPWGQTITVVSLRGVINRENFNIMWNAPLEQGGVLVSTDVMLEVDMEMKMKEEPKG